MAAYLKYLFQMTVGIIKNIRRIIDLSVFEYKLTTKNLFLGSLWRILNPMIQIGVYWIVFGVGLRSGQPIDGIPYVVWLTCGITPWFMMNGCIAKSTSSIRSKASMLTRSNIPTYMIPISSSLAQVLDNIWSVILMFAIYLGNGCVPTLYGIGLVYYIICALAFVSAVSLATSVLAMLAEDFANLIRVILRLFFFLSPIFWKPGQALPEVFLRFDAYNPFGYVIRGFRSSLLYNVPFWEDVQSMLIFWGIVVVFYLIGAAAQSKLRKNLLDFL